MTRTHGVRLASRDALHVFTSEANPEDPPAVMLSFYVFDTEQDANPVRTNAEAVAWFLDRLERTPALRRRLHRVPADLDYPYWVEADVDPEHHIRFTRVGHTSRSELHRRLASMKEDPLDLTRPPWEVHVLTDISGVDDLPAASTIVALRIHHSLTDGLGAAEIARALFDDPGAKPVGAEALSSVPGVVRAASALPFKFARMVPAVLAALRARKALTTLTAAGTITPPAPCRPRTRFDTGGSGPRQFGRVRMDLRDVRAVARSTGTSVNDVILSVVSGGLHSYLEHHGEIPPASLAAIVPRSTRGKSGVEAGKTRAANEVTLMYVDLHTDHADPLERLRLVRESSNLEKQRVAHPVTAATTAPVDASPAVDLKVSIRRARNRKPESSGDVVALANTAVTNVPRGRVEGLRFGDSPVVEALGTPMLSRTSALVHSVTSLGNTLNLTFLVSVSSMPDPEDYERRLASAFEDLYRAGAPDVDQVDSRGCSPSGTMWHRPPRASGYLEE
ncbi:WS/DGAT domain-containing protein [Rhodococcus sp. F64268]|uniref:wax ester/triacylglycerol synthase domain-containing protein n=1 Tax=Rhodococcus sp. F64268 TaxID=2926402 RepID=UPI001FF3393C|nr:wax ester/triacylglycerol synthase domain-containing protein [Rhodococcus sp. F64268]MCK0093343.1 WS/DGAT domain-containing protein [Rhodococcus sp. F64268]